MKIKKVEWRNFSSYGNKKQILDFPNDPGLFQIVGENGAGKSSISQVITFAFYGKLEGKKLSDIPNRINGNAWVRVEFESNGRNISVTRGLEPSLFELHIDGMKYDQAGSRTVQDYLTEDILGIPFYVFNNTILLSINDFKSFIKMSPQDKRAIVDKIFGFHIINQMRDSLKEESKRIKEESDRIGAKIDSVVKSLEKSNQEMENLTSRIQEESRERLDDLKKSLATFEELQKLHNEKIKEFKTEEDKIKSLISSSTMSLFEARGKYKDIGRKLSLYESDKCPTCESSLDTEFHRGIKEEMESEYSKIEDQIKSLEKENEEIKIQESESSRIKNELREKNAKISAKIAGIREQIQIVSQGGNDLEMQSLKRIADSLSDEKNNLHADSFKMEEKSNWIKILDEILGEKGVKQMAIKTILPSLNSEIMELLAEMHLNYQVVFDEEFKATVYHMGIEIPVQTLSTGEMKKVDFVVLIAIMKLMKLKFSSINMLFLDELFSSVDPDGIHSILKILRKVTRDLGLNIFVINHAPMPHEIFDWKLEVSKTNNFSSISIDKF